MQVGTIFVVFRIQKTLQGSSKVIFANAGNFTGTIYKAYKKIVAELKLTNATDAKQLQSLCMLAYTTYSRIQTICMLLYAGQQSEFTLPHKCASIVNYVYSCMLLFSEQLTSIQRIQCLPHRQRKTTYEPNIHL